MLFASNAFFLEFLWGIVLFPRCHIEEKGRGRGRGDGEKCERGEKGIPLLFPSYPQPLLTPAAQAM